MYCQLVERQTNTLIHVRKTLRLAAQHNAGLRLGEFRDQLIGVANLVLQSICIVTRDGDRVGHGVGDGAAVGLAVGESVVRNGIIAFSRDVVRCGHAALCGELRVRGLIK